jgi:uncharacterized protein
LLARAIACTVARSGGQEGKRVPEDWSIYLVLAPMAALAGFIRGFAGFGGLLLLLPTLNHYIPPTASVPVVMWVDLLANVRLLPEGRKHATWGVVAPLTVGTVAAMPVGVWLLVTVDPTPMKRIINVAILAAALVLLSGWRYRGAIAAWGWAAIGAMTGVIMGATSIAVTAALFLNAGTQTAQQARANFIVWVFLGTVALIVLLALAVGLNAPVMWMIVILAPLYLAGSVLGSHINSRAPEHMVRRCVLGLVVVGALAGLLL